MCIGTMSRVNVCEATAHTLLCRVASSDALRSVSLSPLHGSPPGIKPCRVDYRLTPAIVWRQSSLMGAPTLPAIQR